MLSTKITAKTLITPSSLTFTLDCMTPQSPKPGLIHDPNIKFFLRYLFFYNAISQHREVKCHKFTNAFTACKAHSFQSTHVGDNKHLLTSLKLVI